VTNTPAYLRKKVLYNLFLGIEETPSSVRQNPAQEKRDIFRQIQVILSLTAIS